MNDNYLHIIIKNILKFYECLFFILLFVINYNKNCIS